MANTRSLAAAAIGLCVTAALSGCATDSALVGPLLPSAGQSFGNGTTAASQVITAETATAPDSSRRIQIFYDVNKATPIPQNKTDDAAFELFACAGLDEGSEATADVAVPTNVAATVSELTAKPATDLSDVIASLNKYSGAPVPAVKPPTQSNAVRTNKCLSLADGALGNLRTEPGLAKPTIVAPTVFAAVTAASTLLTGAEQVVTDLAQAADQAAREKALVKFLETPERKTPPTSDTDDAMSKALGPCALYSDTLLKADNSLNTSAVPNCSGALSAGGQIDNLYELQVEASLVVPYIQYLDVIHDNKLAPHERAEKLATVQENLADFDKLRLLPKPGELAQPIAIAYLNLRRIAEGKLTSDESKQAFSDILSQFYGLMKQLNTDITAVGTDADSAKQAIQKL